MLYLWEINIGTCLELLSILTNNISTFRISPVRQYMTILFIELNMLRILYWFVLNCETYKWWILGAPYQNTLQSTHYVSSIQLPIEGTIHPLSTFRKVKRELYLISSMISMLHIKNLNEHFVVKYITVLLMGSNCQRTHIQHIWFTIKIIKLHNSTGCT
jgi:hypothetical protein